MKEFLQKLQPFQLYTILVLSCLYFLVQMGLCYTTHSITLLVASYHMLCNIITLGGCLITIKVIFLLFEIIRMVMVKDQARSGDFLIFTVSLYLCEFFEQNIFYSIQKCKILKSSQLMTIVTINFKGSGLSSRISSP